MLLDLRLTQRNSQFSPRLFHSLCSHQPEFPIKPSGVIRLSAMTHVSDSDFGRNISRILDDVAEVLMSQRRIEEILQSFPEGSARAQTPHLNKVETSAPCSPALCGTFEFLNQDTAFPRQTSEPIDMTLWPRDVRLRETHTVTATTRWSVQAVFSCDHRVGHPSHGAVSLPHTVQRAFLDL